MMLAKIIRCVILAATRLRYASNQSRRDWLTQRAGGAWPDIFQAAQSVGLPSASTIEQRTFHLVANVASSMPSDSDDAMAPLMMYAARLGPSGLPAAASIYD